MKKETTKKITLEDLAGMVNRGFRDVDQKFEKVDQRFNAMDKKFDIVDSRFNDMEDRFDGLENRMTNIEKLLLKNDDEHRIFKTKISILEKAR
jgi:DNA anti-recombination protein RmuC